MDKTKYMLLSHHQSAVQINGKKTIWKYVAVQMFDNDSNKNLYIVKIKWWLRSGNACYHSVQKLLFSHLLLKNVKIRIYKTIILSVVLYGCDTWSLMLREELRLRVF
jgi:hypothetical protein